MTDAKNEEMRERFEKACELINVRHGVVEPPCTGVVVPAQQAIGFAAHEAALAVQAERDRLSSLTEETESQKAAHQWLIETIADTLCGTRGGGDKAATILNMLGDLRAALALARSQLAEAQRAGEVMREALQAVADVGCNEHITFDDRKAGRDCFTAGCDSDLGICDACRSKRALDAAKGEPRP